MGYVLVSFLDAITDAILRACDSFGTAVVSMLTLDIGKSDSIFGVVFSSFGDILGFFQTMAMVILALNFCWQIFRIMCTPEGTGETPWALAATTVAAGVLIYLGPSIIFHAERLFAYFFEAVLSAGSVSADMSFSEIKEVIMSTCETGITYVETPTGTETVVENVKDQTKLISLVVVIVMLGRIVYEFIMYLTEVVERYLVLGVLFYASPLAFATAGSKSTRPIFSSFVRMMVCQLFLMVCNVFFFRLFILGMSGMDNAVTTLKAGGNSLLSVYFIICLMLYGILHVGTRIDSYLGSLGLSTAQTGRGLASSIVSSGLGVSRVMNSAFSAGRNVLHAGQSIAGKANAVKRNRADLVNQFLDGKTSTSETARLNSNPKEASRAFTSMLKNSSELGMVSNTKFNDKNKTIQFDSTDANGNTKAMIAAKSSQLQSIWPGLKAENISGASSHRTVAGDNDHLVAIPRSSLSGASAARALTSCMEKPSDLGKIAEGSTRIDLDNSFATFNRVNSSGETVPMTMAPVQQLQSMGVDVSRISGAEIHKAKNGADVLVAPQSSLDFKATTDAALAGRAEAFGASTSAPSHVAMPTPAGASDTSSVPSANIPVSPIADMPGASVGSVVSANGNQYQMQAMNAHMYKDDFFSNMSSSNDVFAIDTSAAQRGHFHTDFTAGLAYGEGNIDMLRSPQHLSDGTATTYGNIKGMEIFNEQFNKNIDSSASIAGATFETNGVAVVNGVAYVPSYEWQRNPAMSANQMAGVETITTKQGIPYVAIPLQNGESWRDYVVPRENTKQGDGTVIINVQTNPNAPKNSGYKVFYHANSDDGHHNDLAGYAEEKNRNKKKRT